MTLNSGGGGGQVGWVCLGGEKGEGVNKLLVEGEGQTEG